MGIDSINIIIGVIGLVTLLIGLIFEAFHIAICSIPLTGTGASVLATAIVNWVLNKRSDNFLISSVMQAFAERSQFIRTDHELDLTVTLKGDNVLLQKVHRYRLRNISSFPRKREISMFTDSTSWQNPTSDDGFIWIKEPSGILLEGDDLDQQLTRQNGKVYFKKIYSLPSGNSNRFEFNSKTLFRKKDRLIWTVEDFSEDFKITITNKTGTKGCIAIKINHHKEKEVNELMSTTVLEDDTEVIHLTIPGEILPYQGFEIMWDV